MDIFNILKQDVDDVIMIINYFLDVAEYGGAEADAPDPAKKRRKGELDEFWNYV